jgi:hypothetical protein
LPKPKNSWTSKQCPGYRRTWAGHCVQYYDGDVKEFHKQEFPHLPLESVVRHMEGDGYKMCKDGFLGALPGVPQYKWE